MAKAQFDKNEVIDKSLELFWRHGFTASSMQQVVKTTGLKPGSIYLAFGNKEGLFSEAVESYSQKAMTFLRNTMDTAPSIGEGICRIFETFIQESTEVEYNSCFLVKTQLELAAEGGELHDLAVEKLSEIETLFQAYLEKEYDEEASRQRAVSIMLHIYGVRVYGYQKGSADRIRKELRDGLPWLPWSKVAA